MHVFSRSVFCVVKMQALRNRVESLRNEFDTPCWVSIERSRTAGAPKALSGRVKFLPIAWAGMPKTIFRKNSDSLDFFMYFKH